MPATKSATPFTWASGSATASGTTSWIMTPSDYANQVYVQIVQLGTATGGAAFTLLFTPDSVNTYRGPTITAPIASGTYAWVLDVPVTAASVAIVYTVQAGGTSSTLTAHLGRVTGL